MELPELLVEVELPGTVQAPAIARAHVRSIEDLPDAVRQTCALVVSELVSNAVVHARRPAQTQTVGLVITREGVHITIEVDDGGSFSAYGRPLRLVRSEDPRPPLGLAIVARLAEAWGVQEGRAWAVLRLTDDP